MPHMGPHVPKNKVYMLDLRLAMVEAHMFARLIGVFSARQPDSQPASQPASQPVSKATIQPASQPASQPSSQPSSNPAT